MCITRHCQCHDDSSSALFRVYCALFDRRRERRKKRRKKKKKKMKHRTSLGTNIAWLIIIQNEFNLNCVTKRWSFMLSSLLTWLCVRVCSLYSLDWLEITWMKYNCSWSNYCELLIIFFIFLSLFFSSFACFSLSISSLIAWWKCTLDLIYKWTHRFNHTQTGRHTHTHTHKSSSPSIKLITHMQRWRVFL